jgi:hypothetical protein
MRFSENIFFTVLGVAVGFGVEALGVLGAPWIVRAILSQTGSVIGVDDFFFLFPLIFSLATSAALFVWTKRLAVPLGVLLGFLVAVALFSFALRGV